MELIDKQAVIDAFNTGLNELVVDGEENAKTVENYLNRVIEKIKCLPSVQLATDTNVGTKLGTNLAEVGTDCISRQAAIDAIEHRLAEPAYQHTGEDWYVGMNCAEDVICSLPPAQPKKGKWIGKYPVASVCSECGYLIHNGNIKAFAYCPNCGAKMEVNHEAN